jgi:hypothetical protein
MKTALRLLLLWMMLAVQTGGLLHASIHDFHDHGEQCDLFHAADRHNGHGLIDLPADGIATRFCSFAHIPVNDNVPSSPPQHFRTRSPPFLPL